MLLLQNSFMLIFYFLIQPFKEKAINRLEIFNEICIITINYHLFLLTDFVSDPSIQYNVGWSILLITVINISINMGYMMFLSAVLLIRKIRIVI